MGADLYLHSVLDPRLEKWQPKFDAAVEKRDGLKEGTPEYKAAQEEVSRCYNRMYERGYFRDSYNPSCLLWRFGLSWWEHVGDLLDEDCRLTPEKAKQLLKLMYAQRSQFEASLDELNEDSRAYFRARDLEFRAFLEGAIRLNASIDCSI